MEVCGKSTSGPLRAECTAALDSSQYLQTSLKHSHKVCKSAKAVKSRHLDSATHFLKQMFVELRTLGCLCVRPVTHWWVVLLSIENTCWIHIMLTSYSPAPLIPDWCTSHCVPVCRAENIHWQEPCEDRYRQGLVSLTFNKIISQKLKPKLLESSKCH